MIPARDFRAFLERSPRAALWILTRLIARLRQADRKRAEFGASDTLGRVAARMVELAADWPVLTGLRPLGRRLRYFPAK